MKDIAKVSYTSDAGTILPELQWHEQIVITKNKVSLARNGRTADTQINAGSWEIPVDAQKIAALFEQLATVDCATINRVEPDDVPDGGGTESYTIAYARGKECSLVYDPGTTYTNGELAGEADKVCSYRALPFRLTLRVVTNFLRREVGTRWNTTKTESMK